MRRFVPVLAAALLSCSSSATGPAGEGGSAPVGGYEDNLVQLMRMEGSTFVEILEVQTRDDGWVFFCSGVKGLTVVDAADPTAIREQWRLEPSAGSSAYPRCQHLSWAGDRIYLTNRGDEIQPTPFITAFDAPDLASQEPVEGPTYTATGLSFEGIAARDDLLFVAAHEAGLLVLRDTGATLEPIGTFPELTNAWGVVVDGDRVYVADGAGGLAAIDVAEPSAPTLLGRVALEGSAQHLAFDPDTRLAYVAAGSAGMIVVDLADPNNPEVVTRADTPGTTLQVSLAGGHAYVADWNDLRVFDLADPRAPELVGVELIPLFPGFPRVLGAAARDDAVFIGEWTGLYSYRFTPGLPAPDIRIASDRIDLGPSTEGDLLAAAIIVENEGQRPLAISSVTTKGVGSAVQTELPITLDPGAKTAIEVRLLSPTSDFHAVSARIFSDDPDESGPSLRIVTNNPGLGVGDLAPEVEVNLLSGGTYQTSEHLGEVVLLSYFATF